MSNYTKVNVRKDLYELIKVQAAADGRSVTNFIERLLRASVNDLVATDNQSQDEDENE